MFVTLSIETATCISSAMARCCPTIQELYDARASTLWNILCCPFVCTIGLLIRSIFIYCLPCVDVLFFRLAQPIHHYLCCCFGWPYVDDTFFGAKALGDHSKNDPSKESAQAMAQNTVSVIMTVLEHTSLFHDNVSFGTCDCSKQKQKLFCYHCTNQQKTPTPTTTTTKNTHNRTGSALMNWFNSRGSDHNYLRV